MPLIRTDKGKKYETFPYETSIYTYSGSKSGGSTLTSMDGDNFGPVSVLPAYQGGSSKKPRISEIPFAPNHGKSLPKMIFIKGHRIKPTEVFDTLWYFAAERKAIDDRRRAGREQPWTDNPILQKYPWCNTYRVLDRVSQFIITDVIEKGSQDHTEIVFRVVLFNTFTKIETWNALQSHLGPLRYASYSRDAYAAVLDELRAKGRTIYTGSFQKPGPKWGYQETHRNHLLLIESLMEGLPKVLPKAQYMAEIYEWIAAFPSMGDFSAYQLLLNLSYSSVINFSENDFVVAGIGAKSGLKKMFGESMRTAMATMPGFDVEIIRWMAKTQQDHFKRLGLEFSGLGPNRLPMMLCDIEHLICEVDKYARLAHPSVKGHGRVQMRKLGFTPSPGPYARNVRLPKAWSHPDRRRARIRPGGPPVVDKRYAVEYIYERRKGESGWEYHVFWLGYSAKDATWEPEELLREDAPLVLDEFLRKLKF